MSNQLVGTVYQRIMDQVIDTCQVTFEEDGVNNQTLDDLRKIWQTKLSNLHVGTFPWEPPPLPQPMVNPTPVPSNVPRPPQVPSSVSSPVAGNGVGGVRIKTEPNTSYESQALGQGSNIPNYGNTIAQQRAAQNLAQKFGSGANLQINQLQAQAAMAGPGPQGQHNVQNIQLPRQTPEQQKKDLDEQMRQQHQYQDLQQAQQRLSANSVQTDGSDEWSVMVAQRRAGALNNPADANLADLTLRQQVEQMSHEMEGGGLMLPLSEQPKYDLVERRKVDQVVENTSHSSHLLPAQIQDVSTVPQYDGPKDSDDFNIKEDPDLEDNDEDAINSDLDDSEEEVVDEGEDESLKGQIMLCTYDKVQRVKNKWKCTLKDGVLTTGGREYVFHKAQGEFEWIWKTTKKST